MNPVQYARQMLRVLRASVLISQEKCTEGDTPPLRGEIAYKSISQNVRIQFPKLGVDFFHHNTRNPPLLCSGKLLHYVLQTGRDGVP